VFKKVLDVIRAGDRVILDWFGGPPEISRNTEVKFRGLWDRQGYKLTALAIALYRTLLIVIVLGILFFSGRAIYQAFLVGPVAYNTNVKYQNEIPTIEATPSDMYTIVPIQEKWLTIQQAEELKTHPGINLVEMRLDGGVRYSALQSVSFIGQSPWVKTGNRFDGLNLKGTSVVITVQGSPREIYILQPFFLESNKNAIYLVDEHGQLWSSNSSVIISLRDCHPRTPLTPDPLLSSGS